MKVINLKAMRSKYKCIEKYGKYGRALTKTNPKENTWEITRCFSIRTDL